MKKKITLLLVLLLSFTAWSQKKSKKLIGTVYNQNDQVLSNVLISKVGNEKTYKTDENGNFALNVRLKDTLIFSKKGYSQSRIPVSRSDEMVVLLNANLLSDKSEIEGALGIKKDKDEITTAYGVIEADNLNIANSTNTVQGLQGKVSGLNVHKDEVYLRGIRSIRANNSALVVIDGVVSTYDFLQTIDYNLIESVTVHKGANGAALYGSQAANGVVIVKTKKSLSNSSNNVTQQIAANSNANKYNKRLKVNVKNTKPAYLSDLNNLNSSQEVFNKYESDKELFKSNPSYYLDMFNYFEEEGNTEYSKTVLNDIINSEDAKGEQLRAFAYRLDELNRNEEANVINNKLLNTYPNDVKSYRDLALGLADVGKSQIAFNTLSTFLDTDLGEIKGSSFNRITLHEVNNMIQNNPNLKKSDLASHNIIKTEFA